MKKAIFILLMFIYIKSFSQNISTIIESQQLNQGNPNYGFVIRGNIIGVIPANYKVLYTLEYNCNGVWREVINNNQIQFSKIEETRSLARYRITYGFGNFRINGRAVFNGTQRPSPIDILLNASNTGFASIRITNQTALNNLTYSINCLPNNLVNYKLFRQNFIGGITNYYNISLSTSLFALGYRVNVKNLTNNIERTNLFLLNYTKTLDSNKFIDISSLFDNPPTSNFTDYKVEIEVFGNIGTPNITRNFVVRLE
jgi:hypothetical protein